MSYLMPESVTDTPFTEVPTVPRLYLAGRIRKERLRWGAVDCTIYDDDYHVPHGRRADRFIYTGPFTRSDDHGCCNRGEGQASHEGQGRLAPAFAGTASHGAAPDCGNDWDGSPLRNVFGRAMAGIAAADCLIAWVDDHEAHGTLIEIGHAHGMNKPIVLMHPPHIRPTGELWFTFQCADLVIVAATPEAGLREFLECHQLPEPGPFWP